MIEIMVDLQGGAKAPLYEKIYEYIRKDMLDGKIKKDEKLPSTRLLAQNLSVSRSTVELAYDQLLAEGYIKAEPCRGFFACDITELYRIKEGSARKQYVEEREQPPEIEIDFSPYAIDMESFPFPVWRRISRNVLFHDRDELLSAGDGQGDYELRSVIAGYLHQARGVNCQASELIIGAGNEYLEILLAQLLGNDKKVLMDNPGYPQAYRTFCNMGYQVKTVPATGQGMNLLAVEKEDPDLIYVMPSHQFPFGTVMPLQQRLELLNWAAEKEGRYLIEDDHDSEYRYRGKPIPSLQSIDRYGRVIYLGTFSKSIAPSLRISYMVLPPHLMKQYHKVCGFYSATVPKMQQEILKTFIKEGHFERHLNKMRGIYRGKHDFLLGELKARDWVKHVSGDHAGLHVLVRLKSTLSEEELCKRALEAGILVSGLSQYDLTAEKADKADKADKTDKEGPGKSEPEEPVILLGYGKPSVQEMKRGICILDDILK